MAKKKRDAMPGGAPIKSSATRSRSKSGSKTSPQKKSAKRSTQSAKSSRASTRKSSKTKRATARKTPKEKLYVRYNPDTLERVKVAQSDERFDAWPSRKPAKKQTLKGVLTERAPAQKRTKQPLGETLAKEAVKSVTKEVQHQIAKSVKSKAPQLKKVAAAAGAPALAMAKKVIPAAAAVGAIYAGTKAGLNSAVAKMRADAERRLRRAFTPQEWSMLKPQYEAHVAREAANRGLLGVGAKIGRAIKSTFSK